MHPGTTNLSVLNVVLIVQKVSAHSGNFLCWCSVYVIPRLVKMAKEGYQLSLL